jgi:hypothetical protein
MVIHYNNINYEKYNGVGDFFFMEKSMKPLGLTAFF